MSKKSQSLAIIDLDFKESISGKRLKKTEKLLSHPSIISFVTYMIKSGETDHQISLNLHIPWETFRRWKAKNMDLWNHIENISREEIVTKMRKSLFKRAMGFTHEEVKINSDGKMEIHKTYYPPDTKALQYILKNYDPQNFKDVVEKQDTQQPIPSAFNFVLDEKTTVELAKEDFNNVEEDNSSNDSSDDTTP